MDDANINHKVKISRQSGLGSENWNPNISNERPASNGTYYIFLKETEIKSRVMESDKSVCKAPLREHAGMTGPNGMISLNLYLGWMKSM